MPILGHVGKPESAQAFWRARRGVAEGAGFQADLSRLHRPDPGERLEQLRLAVPGDPGHADDLAPSQGEADALDPRDDETAAPIDSRAGSIISKPSSFDRSVHCRAVNAVTSDSADGVRTTKSIRRSPGNDPFAYIL